MRRSFLSLQCVLMLATSAHAAAKFNVDFTVGWGGCYRPMEWTPVDLGVSSNLEEPFGGTVTVTAQQDELTTMTVIQNFVLTPDLPLKLPLVTKIAFAADKCEVRILDDRGRTRWSYEYGLWDFASSRRTLTVVGEKDLLIGLVGRRGFGVWQVGLNSRCVTSRGIGKVHVKDKLPRWLPWDWTGYASLDLLVLYDPDWNLINDHQAKAIAQWLTNGGRLLVVLGSHSLPPDHPVVGLLPCEIGQAREGKLSSSALTEFDLGTPAEAAVVYWPLKPRPAVPLIEQTGAAEGGALFVAGLAGFGRVGVLAFDPSALEVPASKRGARFWVRSFAPVLADPRDAPARRNVRADSSDAFLRRRIEFVSGQADRDSDDHRYVYQYEVGPDGRALNAVLDHLLSIPELRPLSLWWVVGLLTLLAVLLGPVDYLVLKRVDRLPLTWITSAACIALFTVGAYYGVRALRSGVMQLRAVTVLDAVEGSEAAWSTTYSGLFAPASDDYRLENLAGNQWWSGIAPTEEHVYAYGRTMAGRKIYCVQQDGASLPSSLPINIWSMQCLVCESAVAKDSVPLEATVERNGDEVSVRIVNRSEAPIRSGCVRFSGGLVKTFGRVAAGETRQFGGEIRRDRGQAWPRVLPGGRYATAAFQSDRDIAYSARGSSQRTQAILAQLRRGAAVVCAEYDEAPVSFNVAKRKCAIHHVQLVRVVVFPQEGRMK